METEFVILSEFPDLGTTLIGHTNGEIDVVKSDELKKNEASTATVVDISKPDVSGKGIDSYEIDKETLRKHKQDQDLNFFKIITFEKYEYWIQYTYDTYARLWILWIILIF